MASSAAWQRRKAEVRELIANGQAIDAMRALLQEMRSFAERECILKLDVALTTFYTDPANFAVALRNSSGTTQDVAQFGEILRERGFVFLTLGQPTRALRDLEASVKLSDGHDAEAMELTARARAAIEVARREEEAKRVPVTILTGFLGAGKTTLLNHILRTRHGCKYAVIENEIGQIGIDNQLLEIPGMSTRTAESITVLDNGCLCCTVRSDLVDAVKQIIMKADIAHANIQAVDGMAAKSKPALDGILIETTGLADPGPVCKTFYADEELRARTRVDGVLTLVDACHFLTQLGRQRSDGSVNESAQQVGFADKVLLNKVDAVSVDVVQQVIAEIRTINSVCSVLRCSLATRPNEVPLQELLRSESFSLDRVLQDSQEGFSGLLEPPEKRRRLDGYDAVHGDVSSEGHVSGHGGLDGHDGGHEGGHGGGHSDEHSDGHGEGHGEGHAHGHGHGHGHVASRHDTGVLTCAFALRGAPLVLTRFREVMNTIRAERAVDLYRYKGVLCIREPGGSLHRAVLQGVHDMCEFEPRGLWPCGVPTDSQIVFIGRKLDSALWGRLLEKCKEGPQDM